MAFVIPGTHNNLVNISEMACQNIMKLSDSVNVSERQGPSLVILNT